MNEQQADYVAPGADLYARLARPFDHTFKDNRGGFEFDYATGEQVTTRLNEELGFLGWSFRIIEHGIHAEADECWVLGELTVHVGDGITRQQFGSQKIKRSRSSGTPLDIGFDLKGAGTDSLKKCATLIGVALYLSEKEAPPSPSEFAAPSGMEKARAAAMVTGAPADANALRCEECGELLTETRFKDGTTWAPAQLGVFGRRKHGRVLCMTHYREAKRKAEQSDAVAF